MLLGSVVNVVLIIVGSLLGLALRRGFKERYKTTVMQGVALTVILIGLQMALKSENILIVVFSMVAGALMGEFIKIEARLENLGLYLEKKFSKMNEDNFARGFVTSSLVFCIGAMAIMGALQSGLEGNHEILIAKGFIDGVTSIVFTSTFGIGVMFSVVPVFLYQSAITLLAGWFNNILSASVILEMSAVGGLLIAAIGINILGIVKIKVGNLLPAIFLAAIFLKIVNIF